MKHSKCNLYGWQPPHCPSPKCLHHNPLSKDFKFKKSGHYKREVDGRCIQRYTCKTCGVTFSSQTFSTTYWQKLPNLDKQIFMKTVGGMANRQIARAMKVSPSTIDRHVQRLARHNYLFHTKMLEDSKPLTEIVVDGFETFELSQYYPFHHNIAVEKGTNFFIHFTDSELMRKGSTTKKQKKRLKELTALHNKPNPKAVYLGMKHLLDVTLKNHDFAIVHSDAHQSYPRAIKETNCHISHVITPGRDHRDKNNKLWEVNYIDMMIRHCSANHRRETIAFSKRRNSSSGRLVNFLVWMNYCKRVSEKDRSSPTPAMKRGMLKSQLEIEDILEGRIFRNHVALSARWAKYYDGAVATRALKKNNEHLLTYAQ